MISSVARDAYVARLEQALDAIISLREGEGRSAGLAAQALTMFDEERPLRRIPPNLAVRRNEVTFTSWPGDGTEWFVVGPDDALATGELALVWRHSKPHYTHVVVGARVAERAILHDGDSEPTLYAVCRIERQNRVTES